MKPLITLILFTLFTTVLAAEKAKEQPQVDHSTIFQHSEKVPPDIKSMREAQVASVINTRGYTYIEITQEDKPVWLAVPTTEVAAGDTIHYTDGPSVQNHHSKTLDKTFDSVIFLLSVVVNGGK